MSRVKWALVIVPEAVQVSVSRLYRFFTSSGSLELMFDTVTSIFSPASALLKVPSAVITSTTLSASEESFPISSIFMSLRSRVPSYTFVSFGSWAIRTVTSLLSTVIGKSPDAV